MNFLPGEHVEIRNTETEWLAAVEALEEEERKQGNSVLIFFKNESKLKKFPDYFQYGCLSESTPKSVRNSYIRAAIGTGKLTLLTRAFGRGIDFEMPQGHQVVVVQTFVSSLVSEETQIMGR